MYASTILSLAWMFCSARFSAFVPPLDLNSGAFFVTNEKRVRMDVTTESMLRSTW